LFCPKLLLSILNTFLKSNLRSSIHINGGIISPSWFPS
jgi:hypothetical protein